jgi:hypothetical protein
MINMELWVDELLSNIKAAGDKGENYDLHLEAVHVKELADEIEKLSYIEIY